MKKTPKIKTPKIKTIYVENKYYVGSNNALARGWGHPTLAKAVAHAEELMDEQQLTDETFIVRIIRVVRRRKMPVEVQKV